MGARGPAGKRADQRMGHRTEAEKETTTVVVNGPVVAPELGFTACEIVVSLYQSLAESGQAQYYEPSDWQYARYIMMQLDDYMSQEKKSPTMFGEINAALTGLMVTEGDRRRLKMEIERPSSQQNEEDASVARISDYLERAAKGTS